MPARLVRTTPSFAQTLSGKGLMPVGRGAIWRRGDGRSLREVTSRRDEEEQRTWEDSSRRVPEASSEQVHQNQADDLATRAMFQGYGPSGW